MSNHTPGPWHLDGFNLQAVIHCTAERGSPQAKHSCGDWETIAKCEGATWQIAQANARLIAAAPEMLEALERNVQSFAECIILQARSKPDDFPVLWQMITAIAKATGETTNDVVDRLMEV